jgi:glucose/arabinose dehydrogenase
MNHLFFKSIPWLLIFALTSTAGKVDSAGYGPNSENWKDIDVPPAPSLSPEEAIKTIRVAPGFKVELVCAEPDIINPVDFKWDSNGRLWVCEFTSYMLNVEGEGEDEKTGRVSVLEDLDGDGKIDKSTVFLDGLVLPRALTFVDGGVLIAEPPHLWYCQDTDGDLKSDSKVDVHKYGNPSNSTLAHFLYHDMKERNEV